MDTNLLDIKFARIGARLKVADRPFLDWRFVGITEDLNVLVFFAPPEGSPKEGVAK